MTKSAGFSSKFTANKKLNIENGGISLSSYQILKMEPRVTYKA